MRQTASNVSFQLARGFTLVEMIVSITLLSLMAMAAVPMLRMPVGAYLEAQARVEVSRELDTVQTRLTADLARALPNSVRLRTLGARQFLEFLDVRAEGRHRAGASGAPQLCPAVCAAAGNNDSLEPVCTERCFTTLGPLVGDPPLVGADWVVVNPLSATGAAGNPYTGGAAVVAAGIKSRLTALATVTGGQRLDITAKNFASVAASGHVYIVSGPVTYECNPATRLLTRHDGYAISAVQPVAFGAAQSAPLASGVLACTFAYTPLGASSRGGLVQLSLRFLRMPSGGVVPELTDLVLTAPVLEP